MITDDKRAFKRVKRKFTVKYKLHGSDESGGTFVSENISLGGVYFISLVRIEIGELLDCRIDMPGVKDEGRWTARVVRCETLQGTMVETFGIAVEFVKSSGDSTKNLERVLS
jgi:hypothetical protein